MLAGETNLPRAARKVLAMGPQALVIKHGEYGATIFFREGAFGIGRHPFRAPALPIEEVKDPTGAGDSFAGGFMGYIASQGELNREVLKRALFYGGVMGSFAVERFGTERLQIADARRNRCPLSNLPRADSPGMSAQPIRRWDRETALLAWLACMRLTSFLPVLLPSRRNSALRRCGRAHQHRAPGIRFPDSGTVAIGNGMAAASAPADDSVLAFRLDVEDRSRRIDSIDGWPMSSGRSEFFAWFGMR